MDLHPVPPPSPQPNLRGVVRRSKSADSTLKKKTAATNSCTTKSNSSQQQHRTTTTMMRRRRKLLRNSTREPLVPGPKVFVALAALCASILWTISILVFTMTLEEHGDARRQARSVGDASSLDLLGNSIHNNNIPIQQPRMLRRGRDSSSTVSVSALWKQHLPAAGQLQLWPDDTAQGNLMKFRVHCADDNDPKKSQETRKGQETTTITDKDQHDDCQLDDKDQDSNIVVLVVRPPGVLGRIVQDFVQAVVTSLNKQQQYATTKQKPKITMVHYRHPPPFAAVEDYQQPTNTTTPTIVKLVRLVTAPMLLQAVDFTMSLAAHDNKDAVTLANLQDVTRQLTRWDGALNRVARSVGQPNTIVLTLQSTLTIPQVNEARLAKFLVGHGKHVPTVPRDKLSQQTMARIDASSKFLVGIVPAQRLEPNAHQLANMWVEEELQHQQDSMNDKEESSYTGMARQVHMLLREPDVKVCRSYPQFCLHQQVVLE